MKTPLLTTAYLTILALQYLSIELIGNTIAVESIRLTAMAAACVIFTVTWLWIAVRILTARQPQTYRDREFRKVIHSTKRHPLIYRETEPTHIHRA